MGSRSTFTVTIPQGEHAEGKDLWTRWGPSGYGHGLTCVGYDDQVGYDLNGDGKITNDLDLNDDGKITLADWERGAYIVVNSWGENWSGDGRIYLSYRAMIDADWERGNYLGRVEVARHQPRMTLRLKLACQNRTDLRMVVGIAGDPGATIPTHEYAPEAFNGWLLFGNFNAGNVPMAGPDDQDPIEVGVDITPLLADLSDGHEGDVRLFLRLGRSDMSKTTGKCLECSVSSYDSDGQLIRETMIDVEEGNWGGKELRLSAIISNP